MEQLAVAEAFLVCHSTGTSICLRLALQQPGMVRGIISITGGPDERAGTPGLRTAIRLAPLIRLLGAGRIIRGRVRNGLKEASADPSWVTDDVVAGYTGPFRDFSASLRALRAMSEAPETDSLASRLPQITAPVLLLVGPAGRAVVTPPATIQLLADRLPEFAIDTVPNAGHYLHEEQPDSVIAAVQRLVRRTGVPARPAGW
jgi:pimeloyl-ACP methyl ester carboxylesterase